MPLVYASFIPRFAAKFSFASNEFYPKDLLRIACEEIIPAGLNSPQGPLTPGSIVISLTRSDLHERDAYVVVQAQDFEDRRNVDERTTVMKTAFNTIFPGATFGVVTQLVTAGWSFDEIAETEFDGSMSMEAAIERYKQRTGHHLLPQD